MSEKEIRRNAALKLPYISRLRGPLDKWGCIRLRIKLLLRLAIGCKSVVLDFKKVPYVDSDGIRFLKLLIEEYPDVKIRYRNASARVKRTFQLAHVDHYLLEGPLQSGMQWTSLKAG